MQGNTAPQELNFDRDNEPQEGDLVTEDHQHFYEVGGTRNRPAITIPEEADRAEMEEALALFFDTQKFWPNVWWISDHGNAHRLEVAR